MRIQIESAQIQRQGKKMTAEELAQHLKHINQGVGVRPSSKQYKRRSKHRTSY